MLTAALILLVIAALGGIVMASRIFKGDEPPKAIAVVHGLAVVPAIILLLVAVMNGNEDDAVTAAFVLSLLAAGGGLYLVSRHIRNRPHPRMVVVMHGLLAAATIITLAVAVF